MDVYPSGIKQRPGQRVEEPVSFVLGASLPPHVQFPYLLAQHIRLRSEAQQLFPGYFMGLGRFLVCPAAKSRFELADQPLSSSGCALRHLSLCCAFCGYARLTALGACRVGLESGYGC